jgi:hypothetical protein
MVFFSGSNLTSRIDWSLHFYGVLAKLSSDVNQQKSVAEMLLDLGWRRRIVPGAKREGEDRTQPGRQPFLDAGLILSSGIMEVSGQPHRKEPANSWMSSCR